MGRDGIGVERGDDGGPDLGGGVDRAGQEEDGEGGEAAESGTEEAGAGCDASRGTGRHRSETVVIRRRAMKDCHSGGCGIKFSLLLSDWRETWKVAWDFIYTGTLHWCQY